MRAFLFAMVLCFFTATLVAADPDQDQSKVSDEAIAVMKDVQAAYDGLKSLEISGTISRVSSHGAIVYTSSQKFAGCYVAPNKFRLEIESTKPGQCPDIDGCTGILAYSDRNNHTDRMAGDVPREKFEKPSANVLALNTINCAPMAFAVFKDAPLHNVRESVIGATDVKQEPNEKIGDVTCLKVIKTSATGPIRGTKIFLIDSKTHLLRRTIEEIQQPRGGTTTTVIDVESTKINGDVKEDRFAWKLPADWIDPKANPVPAPVPMRAPAPAPAPANNADNAGAT